MRFKMHQHEIDFVDVVYFLFFLENVWLYVQINILYPIWKYTYIYICIYTHIYTYVCIDVIYMNIYKCSLEFVMFCYIHMCICMYIWLNSQTANRGSYSEAETRRCFPYNSNPSATAIYTAGNAHEGTIARATYLIPIKLHVW